MPNYHLEMRGTAKEEALKCELLELRNRQIAALETAAYIKMDTKASREFDRRAVRINEILTLLFETED
jgi:hypothetical protein